MRLDEIAYNRTAEWEETSSSSIAFEVDGEPWGAQLQGGEVNSHKISGIVGCGPHNIDPAGDLQSGGLSPQQKMRQAMVGFHTTAKWLVSLVEKYPNADISISIVPASDSRAAIYQQLIDQLQKEMPGVEVTNTGVKGYRFAWSLKREGNFQQASFPKGAWQ